METTITTTHVSVLHCQYCFKEMYRIPRNRMDHLASFFGLGLVRVRRYKCGYCCRQARTVNPQ